MKLLCCHNRYQLRSGEDIAFDTAVALWRRAGHAVRTVERDSGGLAAQGTLHRLRTAWRIVDDPAAARALEAVVAGWRPDVAIVQNTVPLLSLAPYRVLVACRIPVIQVLYNYRFLCLNGQLYTGGQICERCVDGNYLHGVVRGCYRESVVQSLVVARMARANRRRGIWASAVERYVTPDRFMRDKLASHGLPRERFHIIPNPVELPHDVDTATHDGTVLFAGRLTQPKGVLPLLDAALAPGGPVVQVIGDGDLRETMARHPAVAGGRVRLLGKVYGAGLQERLQRTMAVVVPSLWYDNLPMIVSQAFAAGRPVIATRINGLPEYVREGVNGLLVPPGDAGALAEAFASLGANAARWTRLAAGARRTAETEMSEGVWMDAWDAVLADVAGGAP